MAKFGEIQVSAGLVLYRGRGRGRRYLLILNAKGHWDWPKGHVERGESFDSAMVRETAEETGLRDFRVDDGFFRHLSWSFTERGRSVFKIAFFGLGRARSFGVRLSAEHRAWRWVGFEDGFGLLGFPESRRLLRGAESHLAGRER